MLAGKDIYLRALEQYDAELLYNWENDFEIWQVSNTLQPISLHLLKTYIENAHLDIFQTKQLRLMVNIIENTKTIGMIDLFDFDPFHRRAGVGIMIHKDYRTNGYAFDALETLIKYSFFHLNINQLFCSISVNNQKSINLFKKAGFEITGTMKKWNFNGSDFEDVYFLQLIKEYHDEK